MTILSKVYQKVFGKNATTAQMGQFGSLAAGSPVNTKDPDEIQELSNFESGWYDAILGDNSPTIEDMNSLFFLAFRQLAYLFQQGGISEWDEDTEYQVGSIVSKYNHLGYQPNLYVYIGMGGTNEDPETDRSNWTDYDPRAIGSMIKKGPYSTYNNALYLDADGSAVSRTSYAELFERIGTTYGIGDGSTTFNLPKPTSFYYLPVHTITQAFTQAAVKPDDNSLVMPQTVFAAAYGDDIYFLNKATGNFTATGGTTRNWMGLCCAPNGDVYASVDGGDIYKQTEGAYTFNALSAGTKNWSRMTAAPNGDIYALVDGGSIWKQTGGIGSFTDTSQTSREWYAIAALPNGDVYASTNYDGSTSNSSKIYKLDADDGIFKVDTNFTDAGLGVWNSLSAGTDGSLWATLSYSGTTETYFYRKQAGEDAPTLELREGFVPTLICACPCGDVRFYVSGCWYNSPANNQEKYRIKAY